MRQGIFYNHGHGHAALGAEDAQNMFKSGGGLRGHVLAFRAEKMGSCIPCRKKESPGMRIFQESVPNMRIPGDILII